MGWVIGLFLYFIIALCTSLVYYWLNTINNAWPTWKQFLFSLLCGIFWPFLFIYLIYVLIYYRKDI